VARAYTAPYVRMIAAIVIPSRAIVRIIKISGTPSEIFQITEGFLGTSVFKV
jgi:hypothetical protein